MPAPVYNGDLPIGALDTSGASTGDVPTVQSGGGMAWEAGGAGGGASPFYVLRGDGLFAVVTKVDALVAVQPFTITAVKAYRGTAGTSSSTIVDVNLDGTTIFTTQANRPTFAYTDGDNKIVTKTPDVTGVAAGQLLTFDIDQAEGGSPADLIIEVYGSVMATGDPNSEKDSNEIGEWLPASNKDVTIDTEGQYDLTDKVMYKRVIGNQASQQGGFAAGFIVPSGVSGISSVIVEYKASTTGMNLDLTVVDTGGTEDDDTQWSPGGTSKESHTFTSPTGTYTAGETVYILFKCSLDASEIVSLAKITINWTPTPSTIAYSQKDAQEAGVWLPSSGNNVTIDTEGLYDLTDKVLYKRCVGNAASQQGGFASGFRVPEGASAITSIEVEYKASTTSLTIQVDLIDTEGSVQADSGFAPSTTNKESHTFSSPGGTIVSGETVYVLVKCSLDSAEQVELSKIIVNWS